MFGKNANCCLIDFAISCQLSSPTRPLHLIGREVRGGKCAENGLDGHNFPPQFAPPLLRGQYNFVDYCDIRNHQQILFIANCQLPRVCHLFLPWVDEHAFATLRIRSAPLASAGRLFTHPHSRAVESRLRRAHPTTMFSSFLNERYCF